MLKSVYRILCAALILTGCAGTPAWMRPNADRQAVDDALSQCRAEVRALLREQTKREDRIFNDRESIAAASGYGGGMPTSRREMDAGRQRDRLDSALAACMHRQGFTRARND